MPIRIKLFIFFFQPKNLYIEISAPFLCRSTLQKIRYLFHPRREKILSRILHHTISRFYNDNFEKGRITGRSFAITAWILGKLLRSPSSGYLGAWLTAFRKISDTRSWTALNAVEKTSSGAKYKTLNTQRIRKRGRGRRGNYAFRLHNDLTISRIRSRL